MGSVRNNCRPSIWPAATPFTEAAVSGPVSRLLRLSLCLLVLFLLQPPAAGQRDLSAARDKVLAGGKSLPFAVCREKTIGLCESGILTLSYKEISFQAAKGPSLFAAAPSDVTSVAAQENPDDRNVSIEIQIGDKHYSFDPFPTGGSCNMSGHLICSPQGIRDERDVAEYIATAIPRLANGELAPGSADPGANR